MASSVQAPSMARRAPPRHPIERVWRDQRALRRGLLSLLFVAVVWELAASLVIKSPLILVPVSAVAEAIATLTIKGELQRHLSVSLMEFLLGFGLATAVGVTIGVLMATSMTAREYLDPWVSGLYSTPTVALAPLFILWFGLGIESKVAVVFLVAVFPILVNTSAGIKSADSRLIEAARSFGARRAQIFTKVLIPSALPFIVAGLRLGIGRGLVGVVVGELFGAKAGIGYLILISGQVFDTASMFAGVVVLAASGVVTTELLRRFELRIAPWRATEDK